MTPVSPRAGAVSDVGDACHGGTLSTTSDPEQRHGLIPLTVAAWSGPSSFVGSIAVGE